eukprot:4934843-Pyramimonas_sp.AAC.1
MLEHTFIRSWTGRSPASDGQFEQVSRHYTGVLEPVGSAKLVGLADSELAFGGLAKQRLS